MQKLKVSENKRFLMLEDGTPFFWLADTAWELIHRFDREQALVYLKTRASQSFDVIQTVVLAEMDGLRTPNAYGRFPFRDDLRNMIPDDTGEYSYYAHADYILDLAEQYGIYVALVPTWGDKWNLKWGIGPEIFNSENAYTFGKFLGKRYKERKNIIWILGGDRPIENETHLRTVRAMARGIKDGGAEQLMTYHPCGETSSGDFVHEEEWLDFNMIQSGHARYNTMAAEMITKDYQRKKIKPVVEGECNYEDHPVNFLPQNGFFDDSDVRFASYQAVFAGAFGITYGNHSVWPMLRSPLETETMYFIEKPRYFLMDTFSALKRPGACQMKYLKELMESRSFFDRVPAQEMLAVNYQGAQRQAATKGKDYLFVYCPMGLPCRLKTFTEAHRAQWMNPRTGEFYIAEATKENDTLLFIPAEAGREKDVVLVIDFWEENRI